MSNSVRPHRQQPTRLPHLWDSPGKNTGVGCHFLLQCKKVKSESEVAQSCPTLCDPHDFITTWHILRTYSLSEKQIWDNRRRQWQPTPVLLPGKSHGWRSLVGFSPWGRWVGYDWATSLTLFTFMNWRRKWQPTPVFLSGESQGWRSLVGCRLWGRTESDTTEAT